MKFKNTQKIILSSLLATILVCQPAFSGQNSSFKSTKEINEGFSSNVVKGNMQFEELKNQLMQAQRNMKTIDNRVLNLDATFNAFPNKTKTNLFLRDTDLPSVLRIIAKEGGKNIVIDESVRGIINADLRNVSLNEAMQTILTSQELEARTEGNTIYVASRPAMARKGLNRKYVKAFKLNNANAVDIAKILEASIFNKGYKIDEEAQTASEQPRPALARLAGSAPSQPQTASASTGAVGTTTGQSSLVASKTIRGKIEKLDAGSNFSDAGKLASQIKIQNRVPSVEDIEINNNDGGAIVIPDTRTNSILVAGLEKDIAIAQQAVTYLDKPLPQVSIEVSLIELSKVDSSDLGINLAGGSGNFSGGFNTQTATFNSFGAVTGTNGTGLIYNTVRNLSDDVAVRLNALIQHDKAKLLANPTILALDGSESLIKITDQIVSRMTVVSQATTNTVMYTPELSDIGIVLNILPKIGDDGYVTMKIRPSITTFLKEVTFGTSGYANLISTREVILQDARIKSGETLAIAGLIKETDIKSIGKIPLAGDLPVFGPLFRNKTLDHTKTELVILITPKIINDIAYN